MSDPGLYRTKDEVEEWKRRDPLNRCRQRLVDLGIETAALDALEADVKAEIEEWKKRDPIAVARNRMTGELGVAEDKITTIEASVRAEVNEAVRFAEASPPPADDEIFKWVYADPNTDPRRM